MNRFFLALGLLSSLFLTACTSFKPTNSATSSEISALQHWQVYGKLAVQHQDDNQSGYLTWQQDGRHYDLFIAGPFGTNASRLTSDDNGASLLLPKWSSPRTAATGEQLMQQYLGWNFPVSGLRYWVTGQAMPDTSADVETDPLGRLRSLTQHGWQVQFVRYQQQQGRWLPSLIKITGQDFRFTFAISQWTLYD